MLVQPQPLTERRRLLGRLVSNLVSKNAPLTSAERTQLTQLHGELDSLESDIQSDAERRSAAAFRSWLKNGISANQYGERGITEPERAALSALDKRDMGTGAQAAYPGATSGFFVPMGFESQVISAMKDVGCLLRTSTLIPTPTGAPIAFPIDDDTTVTGQRVPENSQVQDVDIFSINNVIVKSYKYSSKLVKASIEFLRDSLSGADVETWLAQRFAVRLARIVNTELLTGTGVGMPNGLLTAVSVGAVALGSSPNDGTTPALTNVVGQQDLENLIASVDVSYREAPGAGFILNDSTLTSIKKLTDKQGMPLRLYRSALEAPSGEATLLGYRCHTHPGMPALQVAASSPQVAVKSVLFGDLTRYTVRYCPMLVLRLTERYAEYGIAAFLAWWRLSGDLLDTQAVKCLTNTY